MKNYLMFLVNKHEKLQKLWRMSKWTFLFVFLGMMNTYGVAYSQNKQQVTISMQDVFLKDILWAIERQTTFVFMYHEADLDKVGKVNVEAKASSVEEILNTCLKGTGLTYVIQDHVIVLKPVKDEEKRKEIRIVGKVTDREKMALPGVTVMVKGTNVGTATNSEGKYVLTLPEMKDIALIFSFVGMESREIKYVGKDTINVILQEDKVRVDEVVVTGYANVQKSSFTGNATTVTKEDLLKVNNKSVIAALQYFDPSFRIKENTLWGSDPNALPEFNIRGESSIGMNKGLDVEQAKQVQRTNLTDNPNLPIFILDGFEVSVQKIYDMDMNRIESMTILKDAAATAMYGSRAANGVVVVTTVAPKPGELRITYNFNGGAEFPDLSDYNLCNAAEKLELEKWAGVYTSETPSMQITKNIEYQNKLANVLRGVDTDWLAKPLRNVFNHKHSLNLQGGVESIRYSLDLNYDSNNGVMIGSHRSRAGASLTIDFRHRSWLQIMNTLSYSSTRSEDSPYGSFSTYAKLQPYNAIYDEDGNLLDRLVDKTINPLWKVKNLESYTGKAHLNDLTENLNVNLFLLKGLQFKGQFSITKTENKSESFVDPKDPTFENSTLRDKGSLSLSRADNYSWNVNAMLYYNNQLNNHYINAVAGVNVQESRGESSSMKFRGFQLGSLHSSAYAAKQENKTNVSSTESRLIGFLASLNYTYNNIYLLDASFRLDGSSQFGSDKRFAPFWSVGVGINVHNYEWLKDNWLLSSLRVRGSYGSTGKVNFPSYTAVTTYATDVDSWYYTGSASSLKYLGNPRLTWETTNTLDVGFSLGFLNDLFYLEASYYHKETRDLIDEVSIRSSSGFTSYQTNNGAIVNKGFEIQLNTTVYRDKDWMVTVNANLGANKNEITELGEDIQAYNKKLNDNYDAAWPDYVDLQTTPLIQYYVGASTSAIYAVRSAGIDPSNGKEKFIKKGGTSTYTWSANDQVVVGDNNPSAQGSLGLNLSFRGFYLNASFMYQWGAQTYNSTLLNKVENARVASENVDRRLISERWKKPGDVAPFYDLKNTTTTKPTSRFVQDYNYFNFTGLSCGYDFNQKLISRWRLKSLGLRFNMNDLCRWSTVKEERGTNYPYSKNYSFTLSLGF
ncbi:SusC/RagA family TonB-linked outer membrane protein [Odoribacter sp. AF15-53]|nr:SusC/RagA family TonB-linked outer membrane protein [Odoribacter sp. AF15-53]